MPKYKVIETHEVPELSKIEKSDITATITLADTLKAMEQNKKGMEQIEAELKIKKAVRANVEEHHPEVKDIDEQTQIMCHTYYEAGRFVKLAEEKLQEFNDAQNELQAEVDAIKKQTGLEVMTAEKKAEIMKGIKEIYES